MRTQVFANSFIESRLLEVAPFCRERQSLPTPTYLMPKKWLSIPEQLANVTATSPNDWEDLDGPDSGVGVDYWYRNIRTGVEAYVNLDQDHLMISVNDQRVYDGEINFDEIHAYSTL